MGWACGTYWDRINKYRLPDGKNLKEEGDLEDQVINGSVILKRIEHKVNWRAYTELVRFLIQISCCEHGHEHSGPIKFEEFPDPAVSY
jgi:hypothetical protein